MELNNRYQKRMKRFELSTLSLARRCSTTELHPHLSALPTKQYCTKVEPLVKLTLALSTWAARPDLLGPTRNGSDMILKLLEPCTDGA